MSISEINRSADVNCNPETLEMLKTPRQKREGFLFTKKIEKAGAETELTVRIPKQLKDSEPVLIVPGFSGIKPVYGNTRDALASELGRPVATMRRARVEKGLFGWMTADKILHPGKLGAQLVVAAIDELHELFEGEPITAAGHSMGGPDTVDAVNHRIDRVSRVVLVGSGGLEEGQSSWNLAKRGPDILAHEVLPAVFELGTRRDAAKIAMESIHYFARHPWRTAGEAINISNRQLMNRELTELQSHDVAVDIVQLGDDRFFPLEEASRYAPGLVEPGRFHVINGLNHMGMITKPDAFAGFIGNNVLNHNELFAA